MHGRIDRRALSLVAQMAVQQPPLMRPNARAHSHRGHGPRADQTGRIYISATSAIHARTHLRSAAGPYIWAKSGHLSVRRRGTQDLLRGSCGLADLMIAGQTGGQTILSYASPSVADNCPLSQANDPV